MCIAAVHLLWSAWTLVVSWLGTTTFAIALAPITVILSATVSLAVWGRGAMMRYWKQNVGLGVGVAILVWIGLFAWATVCSVYSDHVSMVSYVTRAKGASAILQANISDANAQVATLHEQVTRLTAALAILDAQQPNQPVNPRATQDPDDLFQLDKAVAHGVGPKIHEESSAILFDAIHGTASFDPDHETYFRQYLLGRCTSRIANRRLGSGQVIWNLQDVVCPIVGLHP